MMNWIQKNWLWLALGGVAAYWLLKKKDAAVAPQPILPGQNPRPGGGYDVMKVSQDDIDDIKRYAIKEAADKGWSGNVDVQVGANAVRVVFMPDRAGEQPKVATFATAEMAKHAAYAYNVW